MRMLWRDSGGNPITFASLEPTGRSVHCHGSIDLWKVCIEVPLMATNVCCTPEQLHSAKTVWQVLQASQVCRASTASQELQELPGSQVSVAPVVQHVAVQHEWWESRIAHGRSGASWVPTSKHNTTDLQDGGGAQEDDDGIGGIGELECLGSMEWQGWQG